MTREFAQLRRAARLAGQAWTPRFSFVDVPSSREQSLLLIGSGRSGTTWLAELCNFRNEFRTVWEPCNTVYSPYARAAGLRWAQYLHPRDPAPELERLFRGWLEGRLRSRWIDWNNTKRVGSRRLVKSIATTNLVRWLQLRFPEVPTVFIVRHPFAFAESHVALQWPADTSIQADVMASAPRVIEQLDPRAAQRVGSITPDDDDLFAQLVFRWCIENVLHLLRPPAPVHTVRYEELVLQTRAELGALGAHLGVDFDDDAVARSLQPSRTDYRHRAGDRSSSFSASDDELVGGWRARVTDAQVDRGLRILDAFGLLDHYDDSPLPRRSAVARQLSVVAQ